MLRIITLKDKTNFFQKPGLLNGGIAVWFFSNGFYWLLGHHDHARDADYIRAISTFVFSISFARNAVLEWHKSKMHKD